MPLRQITFMLSDVDALKEAMEEWDVLSLQPKTVTRFRLPEQWISRGKLYCLTCHKTVSIKTFENWTSHPCANVENILSVEFKRTQPVVKARLVLKQLKLHLRDGAVYRELWRELSMHIIGLFHAHIVSEAFLRDLYGLDLFHRDALDRLPISVVCSTDMYGMDAPLRHAPHLVIELSDESFILKGAQDWYDLMTYTVTPELDGLPFLEATAFRVREQRSVENDAVYHCMRCEDTILATQFTRHMCRVAVLVTFKANSDAANIGVASAEEALACLKRHSGGDIAVQNLWKTLTEHCLDLDEYGLIEADVMQRWVDSELLCGEVLRPASAAEELRMTAAIAGQPELADMDTS